MINLEDILNRAGTLQILLIACYAAAMLLVVVTVLAYAWRSLMLKLKQRSAYRAAKRKSINRFKTDADKADLKDALGSAGLVLIIAIAFCYLTHGR